MSRESGFTLLELIVAIAIFAMVILTASMGFHAVYSSWNRLQTRSQTLSKLLAIDRVIDSAFKNAIPFTWTNDQDTPVKPRPMFGGMKDRVTLAYPHRIGDPADAAIRFLTLYLDQEGRLVAEYRKSPIVPWNQDETGLVRDYLAENVAELAFMYADRVENKLDPANKIEWRTDWDPESKNFPVAIQITIKWVDGTKESWLRRTAGAGLYESFGKPPDAAASSSTGEQPK